MLQVKLDTGFNIEVDFMVAPFIKRLLALVIDCVIIFAWIYFMNKMFRIGQDYIWESPGLAEGRHRGARTSLFPVIRDLPKRSDCREKGHANKSDYD